MAKNPIERLFEDITLRSLAVGFLILLGLPYLRGVGDVQLLDGLVAFIVILAVGFFTKKFFASKDSTSIFIIAVLAYMVYYMATFFFKLTEGVPEFSSAVTNSLIFGAVSAGVYIIIFSRRGN